MVSYYTGGFSYFLAESGAACCRTKMDKAERRSEMKDRILESGEDYLETILVLHNRNGEVRSIDIAAELDYSKPSVSVAMKNLRERECITVDKGGYITLTEKGRAIAEKVYERHVLFTNWLISLGVSEDTAAEDACRIEHCLSAESFEAIKKFVRNNSTK